MDRLTPTHLVLIAATAVAWLLQGLYLLMPLDLIPDLIPILGLLDDAVGLTGAVGLTWFTATQLRQAGAFPKLRAPQPTHELYQPIDEGTLRAL